MEAILINRLAKFIEQVKSLSAQAQNLYDNLNEENLDTAKVVSAKLKSILSRFSSELYNYFNICKNPDPDEISNFTTYQLQGEENLVELETKLKSKCEQSTILAKEAEPSTYSKLPDLNLPQFSGDLLDWHQFWDQFNSSINRRKLNDVDKLLYLKSSLKGDAARLVDGFNTTNKSYQIAVDTLRTVVEVPEVMAEPADPHVQVRPDSRHDATDPPSSRRRRTLRPRSASADGSVRARLFGFEARREAREISREAREERQEAREERREAREGRQGEELAAIRANFHQFCGMMAQLITDMQARNN